MIYVHELKIKLLQVQVWVLSCFPVVADPSTVEQWRVPFPLAKRVAVLVFPCYSHAEVARILLTLISPICAWKGKAYRHKIATEPWKQRCICSNRILKISVNQRTVVIYY